MPAADTNRWSRTASAAVIGGYFLLMAGDGLAGRFAMDDPHNLYRYWAAGTWAVLKANLLVATPFYRPLGGLYYLPLYHAFGLEPLPYRVASFALLLANVGVLYWFVKRLTNDPRIAALATLAGCYHARMATIYVNNSTIYDTLCFLFFFTGFLLYLHLRTRGHGPPGWRSTLGVLLLYAAALNAKEMAVTLPLFVVLYELLFEQRPSWRCALLGLALTAVYAASKTLGPESLPTIREYAPEFTLSRLRESAGWYLDQLFYGRRWLAPVFLLAALVVRRPAVWFAAVFCLLSPLPVYFVPPREAHVLYLPIAGWAILAGALLSKVPVRLPVLLLLVAAFLGTVHRLQKPIWTQPMLAAQQNTWRVIRTLREMRPRPPRGASLLVLDEPFGGGWDMYFIAKLYFNDHSLSVALNEARPRGDVLMHYCCTLNLSAGRFACADPR